MSYVLETAIAWVPFTVGVANASLMSYYSSNFVTSDIDTTHGTVTGASGSALLGVGSASLAVQAWAVFEWLKFVVKREEGRITTHNRNAHYARAMQAYWWIMLLFYLVAITAAALQVQMVTQYDNVAVSVQGGELEGSFGDATKGLAYTTIGVGGIGLLTYLYAEFFARDPTQAHPTVIEAHGGH